MLRQMRNHAQHNLADIGGERCGRQPVMVATIRITNGEAFKQDSLNPAPEGGKGPVGIFNFGRFGAFQIPSSMRRPCRIRPPQAGMLLALF